MGPQWDQMISKVTMLWRESHNRNRPSLNPLQHVGGMDFNLQLKTSMSTKLGEKNNLLENEVPRKDTDEVAQILIDKNVQSVTNSKEHVRRALNDLGMLDEEYQKGGCYEEPEDQEDD